MSHSLPYVAATDELTVSAWIVNASASFDAGQTAMLACQSRSHGEVQLTWIKNGEFLRQDDDDARRRHSSVLTLGELTSADDGEYVCVATREQESVDSTPLSITVTGQLFTWLSIYLIRPHKKTPDHS